MAAPVLLVADDLSLIASVKRVLAREGYECVLATSAADAVIAFGHLLPGLMLLQPSVEGDRGNVILEELALHPDGRLLKAVLLGETLPGFPWPVEPLPIDGPHLAQTIEENLRTADTASEWTVREVVPPTPESDAPPESPQEPEPWRVMPKSDEPATPALSEEVPEVQAIAEDEEPPPVPAPPEIPKVRYQSSPSVVALTERLFGDLPAIEDELHRGVEAEVMASVDSTLARQRQDEELQRLEDEVRAEAQRRRVSRESRIIEAASLEAPPPEAPAPATPAATLTDEEDFGELSEPDARSSSPSSVIPQSRAREVLARAEQMVLESRAVSDAQRKVDEADARRERAEQEALERRAEHAESLVRRERETRASLEDELERAREAQGSQGDEVARLRGELADVQAQLAGRELDLETIQAERAGLAAALEAGDAQLAELERKRDEKIAELTRQREERLAELNRQQSESISALTRRHDERVLELRRSLAEANAAREISSTEAANADTMARALDAEKASHQATRDSLAEAQTARLALEQDLARARAAHAELEAARHAADEARVHAEAQVNEAEARRAAFEQENALVEQGHSEAELARQTAEEARERAEAELAPLQARLRALEEQLGGSTSSADAAAKERQQLREALAEATAALSQTQTQLAAQDAARHELEQALERATTHHQATVRELVQLKDSLESTRARAEEAEASASLASEKVKDLQSRELLPISLPGRRALGVARHGSVDLEGLARLVCQLVLAQADVRLELGAAGGTRTLWFKKGSIAAAHSDFEAESLIDRARRDGLIDGRQEAELRIMRTATLGEQLEALKSRGFIRDLEAVPLVQRCAEQLALDALSEETSQYRLADEAPGPEVLRVTVPRATLPLLAEALRRAVPLEQLLEQLGGGEAVPVATDAEWDLRALGFSDRERKMLSWVDGEATVEDVSLASGLKPDAAFRALLVAKYLGVVELKPAPREAPPLDTELDVQRLEAKYDEVQDADYFTILGLPRTAGGDEVSRAWQRLSAEFHPLRYSGHPDAVLQQRAQVVFGLLEEAARALEDDRRRTEYARHLLD